MALPPHAERGSVIIWILVCVAMFAALSFTVASMMRGGGTGMTQEVTRTHAAEIMAYAEGVRRAVQTVRASGISLSAISFVNNNVAGYTNNACADDTCKIFNSRGGGISYVEPLDDWFDASKDIGGHYFGEWHIAPDVCVPGVGTGDDTCAGDASTANEDLVMFLPYLKQGLCIEINRQIGIDNPAGAPPLEDGCPWSSGTNERYTGSFIDAESILANGDPTLFEGRQSGCFRMNGCGSYPSNSFVFYQVLVAR